MRLKYYTRKFPKVAEFVRMRDIPNYLLERGQHSATTEELQQLTGVNAHAVAVGMARLRTAGRMFTPAKGLHVVIPLEYRQWGAPPALDFIHPMMTVLHRHYYVAMLSAAELHGAAHQRAQVLQVMVQRHVSDRDFGRARFRFFVGRHPALFASNASAARLDSRICQSPCRLNQAGQADEVTICDAGIDVA